MTLESTAPGPDRRCLWILLGLALLAGAHSALFRNVNDYQAFFDAGTRLREHAPMYRLGTTAQFKYAPPAAFFFAPFSLLPVRLGKGLLVFLGVLALARVAVWARQQAGAGRWSHLTVLLIAPEALQLASFGQCDGLLLGAVAESELRARRAPWRSGALLGAAVLFKPPYLLFLLPLLAAREWRRLAGFAAAVLLATLFAVLWWGGLEPFVSWRALLADTTPPSLWLPSNQGVFGLTARYLATPGSAAYLSIVGGVSVVLVLLFAAVSLRQQGPERQRFVAVAAGMYLTAFLSPLGWWSNLVGLWPLCYLLWVEAFQGRGARQSMARVALALAAVAALFNHHLLGFRIMDRVFPWRHYGICGLAVALLAAAVLWEARSRPGPSDSAISGG